MTQTARLKDKQTSLPIALLVEDKALYPRVDIDGTHVNNLVKALEAGETLPPPVVESKSKTIADGWHRIRAYRRVLGPEGVIDVILRDYSSENELLLDAISMNSSHGKSLDKIDYIRCVKMLQDRGISNQRIALVIHRTEEVVRKLTFPVAKVPPGSPNIIPGTISTVALKRPLHHFAGMTLSKQQAEALPTVPGTSYLLLTRQLLEAVRYDLANRQDEVLQQALHELRDALIEYCSSE